ncbi:hypothetical protein ATANTOWER_019535 [Ataeniobius toweri]|uniref:Uncharacterized protein n=1 Tax=Ataeniobius toweri TaxID=208326 RepID=A0ABU7B833_9TELE|nr:hypothetical protein [Ataeniobius toweri]
MGVFAVSSHAERCVPTDPYGCGLIHMKFYRRTSSVSDSYEDVSPQRPTAINHCSHPINTQSMRQIYCMDMSRGVHIQAQIKMASDKQKSSPVILSNVHLSVSLFLSLSGCIDESINAESSDNVLSSTRRQKANLITARLWMVRHHGLCSVKRVEHVPNFSVQKIPTFIIVSFLLMFLTFLIYFFYTF